jgi:hypothetical protein|tara:strand:+ start:81 stop:737 length:657 start_codon:yes stop_codon:yes gene_type:complete
MKKINYFYQNLSIDKLIDILNSLESERPDLIVEKLTKCVKGYNNLNDEEEFFETYLSDVLTSGQFFLNFKEYFTINCYYENIIYEDRLWNNSYTLYCKKDNKHRLINTEFTDSPANDVFSILDTVEDQDFKKIQKEFKYPIIKELYSSKMYSYHSYHMSILDKHVEKEYVEMFNDKDQGVFFTNPKKPYYKSCINFNWDKSDHKEANELEHVSESEIN